MRHQRPHLRRPVAGVGSFNSRASPGEPVVWTETPYITFTEKPGSGLTEELADTIWATLCSWIEPHRKKSGPVTFRKCQRLVSPELREVGLVANWPGTARKSFGPTTSGRCRKVSRRLGSRYAFLLGPEQRKSQIPNGFPVGNTTVRSSARRFSQSGMQRHNSR